MSKIEDIVDSLENKISKVLHKLEVLKQTNTKLSQELAMQQQKYLQQQEEMSSWVEKYESLKIANSLLGSDENNKETKETHIETLNTFVQIEQIPLPKLKHKKRQREGMLLHYQFVFYPTNTEGVSLAD